VVTHQGKTKNGVLSDAAYRLTRRGGRVGCELASGAELLAALGPREIWRRRRDERGLARLWPARTINARIWGEAASRLGILFHELEDGFFELGSGGASLRIWLHVPPVDDDETRRRALDKVFSHRLMAEAGVPVPEQIHFEISDLGPAAKALDGSAWVVKPAGGTSSGQGATPFVRSFGELQRAVVRAARSGPAQLLERQIPGEEYRILLLDGEPLGAVRRHAPVVVGDGRSKIADLVHSENRRRLAAAGEAGLRVITLDLDALLTLERAGLDHRSTPASGREVTVKASRSQAGARDAETVPLSAFSPELVAELGRATAALGLRLAGVDLVTTDIGRSLADAGGAAIEINGTPGLHYHYLVRDPKTAVPVAVPLLERMLSLDS
jgi:D-alanine-D-alanine ligase-like ATP-grasp enzyme